MAVAHKDPKTGEVTYEDAKTVVNRIMGQSKTVPGSWLNLFSPLTPFDSTINVRDSTKRLIDYVIGDVPAKDQRDIRAALMKPPYNISAPTDEQVLDLYIRGKSIKK